MSKWWLALAATALVALGGCGSDDDEGGGGGSAAKPRTEKPEALRTSEKTRKANPNAGEELSLGAAAADDPRGQREIKKLTTRRAGADRFGGTDTSEAAYDRLMAALLPEIESFWKEQTASVSNKARYESPGHLVSYDGAKNPGCWGESGESMINNAYYCSSLKHISKCKTLSANKGYCSGDDLIAWDKSGLMYPSFKRIGDLSVALIMAHEWGHLAQWRILPEFKYDTTIRNELQADCYSGAWARDQNRKGTVTVGHFNDAIELFYDIGGGQKAWLDETSHGNKFQRTRAFIQGFENGTRSCIGSRFDRVLKNLGLGKEKGA